MEKFSEPINEQFTDTYICTYIFQLNAYRSSRIFTGVYNQFGKLDKNSATLEQQHHALLDRLP